MTKAAESIEIALPDEVPPGWRRTTLGEIGEYINGRGFKKSEWSDKGLPIIRIQNLTGTGKEQNYYDGEIDERHVVNPGDLLISWAATLGAYLWAGPRAALNQHIFKVRSFVDKKFHYYLMQHILGDLYRQTHGSGMVHITKSKFDSMPIVVPKAEDQQKRVVAEIEKQFSHLDEAVANLKRVKANLKRYKAAVLKAAVEGRLVDTPDEFNRAPLQDLIGRIHQGWSPKCDRNREPGPDEWAVITTTAVQPLLYVDGQGKPLPEDLEPKPQLEVKKGDFLVTRKGPRVRAGVACLVRQTRHRLMVCDTVYRFRCEESKVVPEYLEIALNAPSVVNAIDREKVGINESGVSLTHAKLGGIEIPVPSLDDQSVIVAEVDRRLSFIRETDAQLDANLQRAERLRQSILSMAFSGGLRQTEGEVRSSINRHGVTAHQHQYIQRGSL